MPDERRAVSERDRLLAEARDRGRRRGAWRAKHADVASMRFPSMLDRPTNREAHDRVADLAPLDALGDELVLVVYEAARDEFSKHIAACARAGVAQVCKDVEPQA